MSEFTCTRCGKHEPMEASPVPGVLGELLLANTCGDCWHEWDEAQVMLINEHKLNLAVQQHFDVLMQEMRSFLALPQ